MTTKLSEIIAAFNNGESPQWICGDCGKMLLDKDTAWRRKRDENQFATLDYWIPICGGGCNASKVLDPTNTASHDDRSSDVVRSTQSLERQSIE
jgi:hypothetical protein